MPVLGCRVAVRSLGSALMKGSSRPDNPGRHLQIPMSRPRWTLYIPRRANSELVVVRLLPRRLWTRPPGRRRHRWMRGPRSAGDAPRKPATPRGSTPTARTTLYKVDTTTFAAADRRRHDRASATQSLTDLAIDKNDKMVGITLDKLYGIDSTTGTVTLIKDLSQSASGFTSLSYIPTDLERSEQRRHPGVGERSGRGLQDRSGDRRRDQLGSYGTVALGKVVSSGDLVGVRGLGIYATVNVGTEANDYLAKIDPATWKATPLGTGTGFANIFGLGYWAGKFYGFVDGGTGAGKIIDDRSEHRCRARRSAPARMRWYGAGVTTDAPIIAVKRALLALVVARTAIADPMPNGSAGRRRSGSTRRCRCRCRRGSTTPATAVADRSGCTADHRSRRGHRATRRDRARRSSGRHDRTGRVARLSEVPLLGGARYRLTDGTVRGYLEGEVGLIFRRRRCRRAGTHRRQRADPARELARRRGRSRSLRDPRRGVARRSFGSGPRDRNRRVVRRAVLLVLITSRGRDRTATAASPSEGRSCPADRGSRTRGR